MDVSLESPNPLVNILGGLYVTQEETIPTLQCHNRIFKKATALDAQGKPVFRVEGAAWGTSWSWRRKVFDASDNLHLFDFRHESLDIKNRWIVEDATGRMTCAQKPVD